MQAVRIYQSRGVDELILLDIAATPEGRGPDFKMVEELTQECFMPITVGGGVRSIQDVRDLLNAGADKIAICTSAVHKSELINESSELFGSQAIVVSIDVSQGEVMAKCGTSAAMFDPVSYAREFQHRGAGEILLTSVDLEGTMQGYDLDLIRKVSQAVSVPVIAHGGCGTYEHMYEAIKAGASAVAAGAMFQFTDQTPYGAAKYLAERGVETRI